jgi:hypothetical protein
VLPPLPLLLLELPHPATNTTSNRPRTLIGISSRVRRLGIAMKIATEIPSASSVSTHRQRLKGALGEDGGTAAVREVVVMTSGTLELDATDAGLQDEPVGSPVQFNVYGVLPMCVIVKVAEEPAATVRDEGELVKVETFPIATFRTVLPPRRSEPVSGGPKGATMM